MTEMSLVLSPPLKGEEGRKGLETGAQWVLGTVGPDTYKRFKSMKASESTQKGLKV